MAAVKTAEMVTEKTYVYMEQAHKNAEKHMELYYHFSRDHSKTRKARESEIAALKQTGELASKSMISWNQVEFTVDYNSLSEDIWIGDYILRLLLE